MHELQLNAQSKSYVSVNTSNADCGMADGTVTLSALSSTISQFPLPYYLEVKHPNSEESYYDMTSIDYTIAELSKGLHVVTIWLDYDNGCKIEIPFEIKENGVPLQANTTFNCTTGCADLQMENPNGPYTVSWFYSERGQLTLMPGWPKNVINAGSGLEDLCNIQNPGVYKVVVTGQNCGFYEYSLYVDPCSCIDVILQDFRNVAICEIADVYPIPLPTETCDGSLSVSVQGTNDFQILWSTGETTPTINNLCTGTYSVIVTANGCSKVENFDICCCNYQSPFYDPGSLQLCTQQLDDGDFNIDFSRINPSSSTAKDGSIYLNIIGGAKLKTYKWTGPNDFKSNNRDIADLGIGTYNVTVSDGCNTKTKSITLYDCTAALFFSNVKVYNTCPGQNIGEIDATLNNNVIAQWQYPLDIANSTITNLEKGDYCALFSNTETGCFEENCFTINDAIPLPSVTIKNIENSCGNKKTGKVTLEVINNGLKHFTFQVYKSDAAQYTKNVVSTNALDPISATFSNLEPGTYYGEVITSCQTLITTFEIGQYEFNVDYTASIGCENNSILEILASGDNPPFTYKWNNGLPPVPKHTNLKRGIYTVTVTDTKTCSEILTIEDLKSSVEIIKNVPECQGLKDGSITLRINNPSNRAVEIRYSFGPCPDCPNYPVYIEDPTVNPLIVTLNNLYGTEEYSLWIGVDECFEIFKFKVGVEKVKREFSRFEEDDDKVTCIYDELCKDHRFEDNIIAPATMKTEDSACEKAVGGFYGLFNDCGKTLFFCDDKKVHENEFGAITLRVGEWMAWMYTIGVDPLNYGANPGDLCSYITVCENKPDCLRGGGRAYALSHHIETIDLGNGCFRIVCKWDSFFGILGGPSYTVCGVDFLPDYIPFYYEIPETKDCFRKTVNIAELIHFKDDMIKKYGDKFTKSDLYKEVLRFTDDHNRYCSYITFCEGTFDVVDIDITQCEILDPPCDFNNGLLPVTCVPDNFTDISVVFCRDKSCFSVVDCECIVPVLLNLSDFKKFSKFTTESFPDVVRLRSQINTRFERFSKSIYTSNFTTMEGLFSTKTKKYFFHNFEPGNWVYDTTKVSDFVFQDFIKKRGLLIRKSADKEYKIYNSTFMQNPLTFNYSSVYNFENTGGGNSYSVKKFEITALENLNSNYIVAGQTDTSYFTILIDSTNLIRQKQTISGYKENTKIIKGHGFTTYVTKDPDKKIKVNGSEIVSKYRQINSLITIKDTYLGHTQITEHISWVKTNRLINVINDYTNNTDVYIFKGLGGFTVDGVSLPETKKEVLYIISYQRGLKYYKIIELPALFDFDSIPSSFDSDGNIYLTFNFKGEFTTSDFSIRSYGMYDPVIVKYSSQGDYLGFKHYGSESNEIIKDIVVEGNILNIGGDLEGNTRKRKIGELEFLKFDTLSSHGYISVTGIDGFNNSLIDIRTLADETLPINFEIFPNPTSSVATIRLDRNITESILVSISNLDGQTLFTTILNSNAANSKEFILQTSALPVGVYSVQLMTNKEILGTKKLIKMQ